MPCFLGCAALFVPRVVIILVVIFSDYLGTAYQSWLWPLLGFIFTPVTTLAYAWAVHSTDGAVRGIYLAVVVVAVLMDFGFIGTGFLPRRPRP